LTRFVLLPAALVTALAFGCASEPATPEGAGASGNGGSAGSGGKGTAGGKASRCPDGPFPKSTTEAVQVEQVSGKLVDEEGEPTPDAHLQVCAKNVCYDATLGSSAEFDESYGEEMDAPACKFGDGKGWGKLAIALEGGASDVGTLTVVTLPALAQGAKLVAGTSASSGDVTLTLSDDARVEIDELTYEDESEWAFRAAPFSDAVLAELGRDFALGFSLVPHETVICPAPALSVENTAGLEAGAALELFVHGLDVSEEWAPYAGWEKVGEGEVSEDGATLEFPDGVPVLTAIGIREKG
jgi:hypothetical protein